MRNQIPFFRDIVFISSILTTCLLFTQCVKCQDENGALNGNKKILTVNKPHRQGKGAYYVEIAIIPLQSGSLLSQYTLQAVNTLGKGELKASTGIEGGKHKYEKTFSASASLDTFYLWKGNEADFKAGKAVKIKCMYSPEGNPQNEEHRVKIKACADDGDEQVAQEQEEEVVFLYGNEGTKKTAGGLLQINQESQKKNGNHYVVIIITPLQKGDILNRYTLQAATSAGAGKLKAATEKNGINGKYQKEFASATSLGDFYLWKSTPADFQAGKAVKIRCMYPKDFPAGSEHRVKITACAHDSSGKIVETKEEEVTFIYKAGPSSKANKSGDFLKVHHPTRKPKGDHYVEITITPLQAGDNLHQYTLKAITPPGAGKLKAATEKNGINYKYEKEFASTTSLGDFYLWKSTPADFQAGKAVKIKCMYPKGFPAGSEHGVKITACAHDSSGKIVETKEEEVVLTF